MSKVIRLSQSTYDQLVRLGKSVGMPVEKPREIMDIVQALLELDEARKTGSSLNQGHPFYFCVAQSQD